MKQSIPLKLLLAGLAGVLLLLLWPLPPQLLIPSGHPPVRIEDRNGKLLYELRHPDYGSQEFLGFESIPQNILLALLATEDRSFFSHWGVRPFSIFRALWQNYTAGKVISGGSTITQQLVRNRLQPKSRGYAYKIYEMFLALKLETRLSKVEILEAYLNSAYFGQQAYGIAAASKTYFGKSVAELSRAESALLVGLLQSPSGYNPFQDFEAAKKRQELVLKSLKDTQFISTAEYEEALEEPIKLVSTRVDIRAPHFVFWVLSNSPPWSPSLPPVSPKPARNEEGGEGGKRGGNRALSEEGVSFITTTLDLDLQTETELIVRNKLAELKDKNVTSAAVVILDAHTGEILAMVGSADYFDSSHDGQVNVAISPRQPGSALKPFTYALALTRGDTAASTVADIETQFFTQEGNPYIPRNYDYGYHGLVRYREALANSYNIPAVKVLEKVGVGRLLSFLSGAGISTLTQSPEFYGIALTLGSGEVTLLELTQAFGIFPREGKTLPITATSAGVGVPPFKGVRGLGGDAEGSQILDPKVAWLISSILSDEEARIPEFGESGPLSFDFPVAAKTGTTRNSRDNWTVGFTPDRIVGVWVGNVDNSPMRNTSGISGAGPIFHDVMQAATKNLQPKSFPRPQGMVQKEICRLSGKLPTEFCSHTMKEWFIAGTEPREEDDLFQSVPIDTRNGLKATGGCDQHFVHSEVFVFFPAELQRWARENGWKQPPTQSSELCGGAISSSPPVTADRVTSPSLRITKPHQGDSFQLDPLIPDENEKIILEARTGSEVQALQWYVNGELVGSAEAPDFRLEWQPEAGLAEILAKNGDESVRIEIEVLD
ncbi:MAG: transglycosylase domain-containing protein [bacterium]|nr:transglycosylase domain-containing protein [bacterium]